jgi:DNA topoisomerase I
VPLEEKCPECGRNMVKRFGRYGEFISCSGYPDCKYVKQNWIGVKCPQCKTGDLAEKKARRGNFFYGCSNYPKCDFTAANKPVAEKCPSCGSEYLVEKTTKDGVFLACPNNRAGATAKRGRGKKAEAAPEKTCDFSKQIGPPEAKPPVA